MEINTLLLNFHRWTAIFCRRQSNGDVSYWKKIIFRLRFSLFRLLSLVALCCSWFMSKGSSENLIKYFIFLSSQVNKYWSGRLQSQNLARRPKKEQLHAMGQFLNNYYISACNTLPKSSKITTVGCGHDR